MSQSKLTLIAAAALAMTIALAGCRQQQQQQQQPQQPQQPAVAPPTVDQGPQTDAAQPMPGTMDHLDSADPRVQGRFPRSGAVGQWKKVRQVELYPSEELGRFDPNHESGYRAYGVTWAADTIYQLGDQSSRQVYVQLLNCGGAKEAYGLMTALSARPLNVEMGPGAEAWGDDLRLNVCKGEYLVCVQALDPRQPTTFAASLVELAQAIVGQLPAARIVRPDLITSLPTEGLGQPAVQYFRGGLWLSSANATLAKLAQIEAEDELVLAHYSFHRPGDPAAMLVQIFVVRYASPAKAADAYERLDRYQKDAAGPGTQLLVGGTRGNRVYGTLTGDSYGLLEGWVDQNRPGDSSKYPIMPTLEALP